MKISFSLPAVFLTLIAAVASAEGERFDVLDLAKLRAAERLDAPAWPADAELARAA